MQDKYIYPSKKAKIIAEIISVVLGIIFYLAFGALGTFGIAILLLWIVHNYKYEKYENLYELYDIVNKKHIAYIRTRHSLRKGENICETSIGDWYIEEVNTCFKRLYAYDDQKFLTDNDEGYTFHLLKCRKIYDMVPEKLLKEEQIEKVLEDADN